MHHRTARHNTVPHHNTLQRSRLAGLIGLAAAGTLLLAACAGGADAPVADGSAGAGATEVGVPAPRLVVSTKNSILVLDGATLEVEAELASEEFTRLNAAGDGRHVLVTMSEGFQVLDAGTWTDEGGTSWTAEPALTELIFEADTPGHVVRHAGRTVLYADGTSDTTVFDTAALLRTEGSLPETETIEGVEAHHGVSVVLEDGTLVTTVGNADGRNGIRAVDDHGHEIAVSEQCPGVHGEGTAANEAVVFGCENGALLYQDGEIVKLEAPDQPYGRMGNAYVAESSPLIVGDYKNDPDAEGYLLSKLALIDTEARTFTVVELPEGVEYTFRDVARAEDGRAFLIASDGALHEIDPATGEILSSHPVIEAWEGPADWQDAHPAIVISGDVAYISEPAANTLHAVDLATGEILASVTLDAAPNELAVAAG